MDAIKNHIHKTRPSLTVAGLWLWLADQFCSVFCGRHCSIRLSVHTAIAIDDGAVEPIKARKVIALPAVRDLPRVA